MTARINGKDFRNLQKKNITVRKVYNFYRTWYVPAENRFHTFIYFPARLTDEIVYSEDRVMTAPIDGEKMVLREQIWNKDERKFEFHKVWKIDLKLYKKVIDIVAVCDEDFVTEQYDSSTKWKVNYVVAAGEEFLIEAFSAGKLRDLLDTLDCTDDVVEDADGKRPFDWEDSIRKRLEGKAFSFKVTGQKLETRYTYKEVEPMVEVTTWNDFNENIELSEIPF